MSKHDNMLAILWMLNSGEKCTAKHISEKLEIHIRTVYRYIDALCASGVPIISDTGHNGGYSLLHNFIKSPLLFSIDEKKTLLQAAQFAKEAGYPSSETLDSATSKLKRYSNQEQEALLSNHLTGLEVINRKGYPALQPVLQELEYAVAKEWSVEISYRNSHEEHSSDRVIDPYGLVNWNNKWYTTAFCHLRNEIRRFRVDRIMNITRTPLSFKRPHEFSARSFFMKNLLPDVADQSEFISFIIRGRAESLDDLCIHWFLEHHLQERTSTQAIFLMEEKTLYTHIPYIILPYGKSIQVIEPQRLKNKLVEIASELMEYYQDEHVH
ncbi:DNA-binding transcriptional regulator [Paenibacillus silvae]|uniref:DNA-binding transcriptional regulator n=1 Tax=Paenibacillus silvae TaxID=1325358 RepID=A0ABQ1ZJR5_9BACL|nr:WYL domain-containing protein [Paenibacillus silvae]GGH68583.1 DNA-binding transcriptional regulator [Paenibacillus silvae]